MVEITPIYRYPFVAGQFYMGYDVGLEREIKQCMEQPLQDASKLEKAIGVVVPHAGYDYSGKVACKLYTSVVLPKYYVIIGPNHHGFGKPISIHFAGSWKIPFGDVPIDTDLASALIINSKYAEENFSAHRFEHSVEVQLPFLYYFRKGDLWFVPIAMMDYTLDMCEELGLTIAKLIEEQGKEGNVLIIASTDFTHYEPQVEAEKKDKMAIKAIIDRDPERLFRLVEEHDISMCGPGPVATMIYAAEALGATEGKLVKYSTSAEVTEDYDSVVGYAGIIIK